MLTAGALVAVGVIWVTRCPPTPRSSSPTRPTPRPPPSARSARSCPTTTAHLDEDQQAADSYLTPDYRKKYDDLFEVDPAERDPHQDGGQDAGRSPPSIVRSGDDRVEVFLFVDQADHQRKQHRTPEVYKNQVRAQMQQVGGQWLVDCLITTPNGHC